MIGVYHEHTHARTHTQAKTALFALLWPCFLSRFSSWRYLPFNSIKTFKQPNWKQLPGKIKLHKQKIF